MNNKNERRALGRGLSALISPAATPIPIHGSTALLQAEDILHGTSQLTGSIKYVKLSLIHPNPKQPRTIFTDIELEDLANSIKKHGVLQPILVRSTTQGFQIVAGERRWRAAKLIDLEKIPVIEKDFSDSEALQIALVENLQRQQLNPVEEARGYERLINEFAMHQDQLADIIGKSRSTISNLLRLLRLPDEVLRLVETDKITVGHAKAILTVKDHNAQVGLARKVIADELSVRALEQLVAQAIVLDGRPGKRILSQPETKVTTPSTFSEIEEILRRSLGTRVSIHHHATGKGFIKIEYFSEEELQRLIESIAR